MKQRLFLALAALFFSVHVYANPFKVIIDPGHGGTDSGATVGSLKEADLTLQISKKVSDLLRRDENYESILTRTQDHIVTLNQRCKIAKENKADLFISIHMNSSPDQHAHGTEVYFQSQMPADEETLFLANRENTEMTDLEDDPNMAEKKGDLAVIVDDIKKTQNIYSSQIFAETLIKTWKKHLSLREQPIRQGPFRVLVNVPMPSVLIEVGFLTHREELEKLKNPQYQNTVAETIYTSIKKYKEKMDKSEFSGHSIYHATRF